MYVYMALKQIVTQIEIKKPLELHQVCALLVNTLQQINLYHRKDNKDFSTESQGCVSVYAIILLSNIVQKPDRFRGQSDLHEILGYYGSLNPNFENVQPPEVTIICY